MYYIVYRTTNLINNKKYIGMHYTTNLHDSYLGSGKILRNAIKKYGKSNFTRDILFIFDNYESMSNKEKELITEDIINDESYYNLKYGGEGGRLPKNIIEKIRLKNIGRKVKRESIEKGFKTRKRNGTWYKSGKHHHFSGKNHNPKSKLKISNSLSSYYKDNDVWNKGLSNYESTEERKKYGRKGYKPVKNRNNDIKFLNVNDERIKSGEYFDVSKDLVTVKDKSNNILSVDKTDPRYVSGELVGVTKGNKWIHNKILKVRKNVKICQLNNYLENGWCIGMGPKNLKQEKI